jgi:hypothetical protein
MIDFWGSHSCFKIDVSNPAWCKCWLEIDGTLIYLGAESLNYLKSHLLLGLNGEPKKSSGNLNGNDVSWVMSLAEIHTVLYLASKDDTKILFFQNADDLSKKPHTIEISQKETLVWLHTIEKI